MNNLLNIFRTAQKIEIRDKEVIIQRLLNDGHITPEEAIILMKTIEINIRAKHFELSSGAKITGGSDFETNHYNPG